MNDPKVGKVCKSVRLGQNEYTKLEQDAMLTEPREEDAFFKCFDGITGNELPWQAVKQAREKELQYLRELVVCEKVDERAAVAKYNVTPVDTKWVDTDKGFEEEPMQIRSRIVDREFKSGDRNRLVCRDSSAGSSESFHIRCCESQSRVPIDACRCFPFKLPCQGSETVLVKLPAEDCSGKDKGNIGLLKKSIVRCQR